jgi:hypothetical protein
MSARGRDLPDDLARLVSAASEWLESVDEIMKRVASSPPPRKDEKSKKKPSQKSG